VPVDELARYGSLHSAAYAQEFCPHLRGALFDHARGFADWMFRMHRKHRESIGTTWRGKTGLGSTKAFKVLDGFADDWVRGRITPEQALRRVKEIRVLLNTMDEDGVDGDDFWAAMLLDNAVVHRRFGERDAQRMLEAPAGTTYHSSCLATSTPDDVKFATPNSVIEIVAPVVAFPILLFTRGECEIILLDVHLRLNPPGKSMNPVLPLERTINLETVWLEEAALEHQY
jgi:hypothetical protein